MNDTTQKTFGGLQVRAHVRAGYDLPIPWVPPGQEQPGCYMGQCPQPPGDCYAECMVQGKSQQEQNTCLDNCFMPPTL